MKPCRSTHSEEKSSSQVADRNEGELSGPAGSGRQAHQAV